MHAKNALQPLTEVSGAGSYQDGDNVHAKDALQPLTQVPADGAGYADRDNVHAKDALQPLTQVTADRGEYQQGKSVQHQADLQAEQPERKGIIESVMEYLPGHQQTGTVQVGCLCLITRIHTQVCTSPC